MRFQFALALIVAALCSAGVAPLALAGDTLPPTLSARYELPMATTGSSDDGRPGDTPAVAGLVYRRKDGSIFSSVGLNRITCRAVVGGEAGIEWLGTWKGVKAIDHARRQVAVYTRLDGLPGDYVEAIAADTTRVFCLVRDGSMSRLALCSMALIGADAGHWTTVATIDVPVRHTPDKVEDETPANQFDHAYVTHWGVSHLVLLPNGDVIVAPSAVDARSDALLYRWNGVRRVLEPIAWDPALHATSDVLGISDLCWDAGGSTLYLATTMGLLSLDPTATTTVWHRALADRRVDSLLATPGIGAEPTQIYAAIRNRPASIGWAGDHEATTIPYQLVLFHPKTGVAEALPSRIAPARPMGELPSLITVEAITRDSGGAVWLTAESRVQVIRYPLSRLPDAFSRYDPTARTWTEWDSAGRPPGAGADGAKGRHASASVVPDDAVRVLAFTRHIGFTPGYLPAVYADEGAGNRDELNGVADRFPDWISPDAAGVRQENMRHAQARFDDPVQPNRRWTADGPSLVPVPVSAGPTRGLGDLMLREVFTMQSGGVQVPPRVVMLAPAPPGADGVVVQCKSGIFKITDEPTTGARHWRRLPGARAESAAGYGDYSALNTEIGRVGVDQRLVVAVRDEPHLLSYDPAAGRFVKTGIDMPMPAALRENGAGNGVWIYAYGPPQYIGLRGGTGGHLLTAAPQTVEPELPARLKPRLSDFGHDVLGFTGSIVWYQTHLRRNPVDRRHPDDETFAVIGFDAVRKRWTAPLRWVPHNAFDSCGRPLADAAGNVAIAMDDGSVFLYENKRDSWRQLAGPTPASAEFLGDKTLPYLPNPASPDLIGVDDRAVYLRGRHGLSRFDRAKQVWTAVALPPATCVAQPAGQHEQTAMTGTAIWMGSDDGLWRFDRARETWEEVLYPISLDPPTPVGAKAPTAADEVAVATGSSLEIVAVDSGGVWGIAQPRSGDFPLLFRWDRSTRRFTIYGRASDMPKLDFDLRYIHFLTDGDSVWFEYRRTTYRLNPRTGKLETRFVRQNGFYGKPPALPAGVLPGEVAAIVPDPVDADIAYLRLERPVFVEVGTTRRATSVYRLHKASGMVDPLPIEAATVDAVSPMKDDAGDALFPLFEPSTGFFADSEHLWLGTWGGLLWMDRKTCVWSKAQLPADLPDIVNATDIHADPTGALWISDGQDTVHVTR